MPAQGNRFSMSEPERSLEVDGRLSYLNLPRPLSLSPFDKLPTEIVEEIFSSVYPDVYLSPRRTNPTLLSLVCKMWLNIATKQRSLWATFEIMLHTFHSWSPGLSSHLHMFLQKSGSRPLRITVTEGRDEMVLEALDVIIRHSERWESITFTFPLKFEFLRKLDAVQDRLPLLQYLHITGSNYQYPTGTKHSTVFSSRSAPSLTRVSLTGTHDYTFSTLELPWNRLSRVDLTFIQFTEIQEILPLLQSRATLRLHKSIPRRWSALLNDDNRIPSIQFERLQELHAIQIGENIADLICPSLKRLLLTSPSTSSVLKFLDNSSCGLVDIEIVGDNHTLRVIYPILLHPSLANLRSLILKDYYLNDTMLDILLLDAQNKLLSLETLCIHARFRWINRPDFESRIVGLQKVVESRTHAKRTDGSSLDIRTSHVASNYSPSLKHVSLVLEIHDSRWGEWEDMKLEELRSFFASRNVIQSVRILKDVGTGTWVRLGSHMYESPLVRLV